MTSIWQACGSPPWGRVVPFKYTPAWAAARHRLDLALQAAGCPRRFRSWQTLWSVLHGTAPPCFVTWGNLCSDFSVANLLEASLADNLSPTPTISYWNLRWLRDPFTDAARNKRECILSAIRRQRLVAVVETHWDSGCAARWGGVFPMATVIAAPARPGPNGGSQGGTAVFLPPRISCLASSILIPGCVQCVDCRIDAINVDFTVVVVYLPPDSRPEVLAALLAFTSFSSPVFFAGDFNFDLSLLAMTRSTC